MLGHDRTGDPLHVREQDVPLANRRQRDTALDPRRIGLYPESVRAGRERTTQRRRDAAHLATDIERLAALVLDDLDHARIAGKAARGLDRDRRTVLDLATTGRPIAQSALVHVHDDLVTVPAVQGLGTVLQEALGEQCQGIRPPHGHGWYLARQIPLQRFS